MKPFKTLRLLLALATLLFAFASGDDIGKVYDFEKPDSLSKWKAVKGKVSISDRHNLNGGHSLRWDYEPGGVLIFSGKI